MSTAMVSLGIATGFERGYGVLKRLGSTPLGRPRLLGAKIATVLVVEVVQAAVLVPVGYGLGWRPAGAGAAAGQALAVALLATAAFGGSGSAAGRGAAGRGQPGRRQRRSTWCCSCWAA